jgi:hypothetical protein
MQNNKRPEGALDINNVREMRALHSDTPVFLVFKSHDGKWMIRSEKASDWRFNSPSPNHYFTNYWFAYGYTVRMNGTKDSDVA